MYGMLTKAERRVRYEELMEMVRRERERNTPVSAVCEHKNVRRLCRKCKETEHA